jgi:hypothetical protein
VAGVAADQSGYFHQPIFDKINTIAGSTFPKNVTAGGELPFLRHRPQSLQSPVIETAEQGDGFKFNHKFNLLEKFTA